jgi:flavin-dependent dehydrogenase
MCGEVVSKWLFEEIAPLKPDGIIGKVRRIANHWPEGITLEEAVEGAFLDRPAFLRSVIRAYKSLGGVYSEGEAKVVSQTSDKVRVDLDGRLNEYDYVIACDGANSSVRRELGLIGRTEQLMQVIADESPEEGVVHFYYDERYNGGYRWAFPHEGKVKIGWPLSAKLELPAGGKILTRQSRAIGYGGLSRYVRGRVLLAGDAACQTNALTNGGIRNGMVAGKMAAEAVSSGQPEAYDYSWKRSKYASHSFLESFDRLSRMPNKELSKHIRPLMGRSKVLTAFNCALFYTKYLSLYRSYNLAARYGW